MKAQLQGLLICENSVLVPSELCFEDVGAWSKGILRASSVCPELAALAVTPRVADECDYMSSAIYDSVESVHQMYLVSILYKA